MTQCSGSVMCSDLIARTHADTGMRPVHSQSLHC